MRAGNKDIITIITATILQETKATSVIHIEYPAAE